MSAPMELEFKNSKELILTLSAHLQRAKNGIDQEIFILTAFQVIRKNEQLSKDTSSKKLPMRPAELIS